MDYVSVSDPETLKDLYTIGLAGALISLAVQIGLARLIDNILVS